MRAPLLLVALSLISVMVGCGDGDEQPPVLTDAALHQDAQVSADAGWTAGPIWVDAGSEEDAAIADGGIGPSVVLARGQLIAGRNTSDGRLAWASGDGDLYFSSGNHTQRWDGTNMIQISMDAGDVRGLTTNGVTELWGFGRERLPPDFSMSASNAFHFDGTT